jgi:hypothetical protein
MSCDIASARRNKKPRRKNNAPYPLSPTSPSCNCVVQQQWLREFFMAYSARRRRSRFTLLILRPIPLIITPSMSTHVTKRRGRESTRTQPIRHPQINRKLVRYQPRIPRPENITTTSSGELPNRLSTVCRPEASDEARPLPMRDAAIVFRCSVSYRSERNAY